MNIVTQKDAKEAYKALLIKTATEIKEIDKNTPWSEIEPTWWIQMMDLQRSIYTRLDLLENKP